MNRILLLIFSAIIIPFFLGAQITREPGSHLPKPTARGVGKIDTRVDNMSYWRKMADSGFVYVSPVVSVPPAIFKGSEIQSPLLMNTNSPDVPTTTVNSTQSENSVFVNPTNNLKLLNSNNSTTNPVGSSYGADYLLSADGGATWGGSVNGAGGSNSGDPTTAISLTGRQYIGFINNSSGQSVAYSTDNGSSWTAVVAGTYNGGLLDKNHMWIDNSSVSTYEGNVYSAWTDFGSANRNQIVIVRSVNDGISWSSPINLSSAVLAGSHNQGVNIQTGPNGEVYAIWAIYDGWPTDETAIGFAKSTNGGTSYAAGTRIISNIRGIRTTETSKNQRVNSFPSMAVDISGGPNNGNIYIVWTNVGVPGTNTGSDIDIYMIRSTNGGTNWSAPIRVNQDPAGLGKEHYFPWITCDPVNGDLNVIFYDDRNVSSAQCEVYVAYSFNAGTNWEDFKVSDVAFAPSPIPGLASSYMGDYLGIAARNGKVYPTWPDNRTGTVITYVSPFELNRIPGADFSASNLTPCANATVTFMDMSVKYPTSWAWSISPSGYAYVNGTSSASQNPQVSFGSYGTYSVQLIVSNTYGSDTLVRSNYIAVNSANANFSANITHINVGNSVIFTDLSSCTINSYLWSFGSGASPATATTAGPHTVTYSTAGFKNVSLTVNGNKTKTKNRYILVDAAYCSATATTCDEYISNVTIGNINNGSACTSGGYQKYTQYWTKVSPGTGYPIAVSNGLSYNGDQCGIWVDWNHDLDFNDAQEIITVTGTPGLGPYTATITPPVNAISGATRMRIRIMYTGTISACGSTQYGETEDYTLYVGTPGLWEGGAAGSETSWNVSDNWDDGRVPSVTTNVVIPDGATYYPSGSGVISCQDVLVNNGASLTVQPGATLNVNGNLTVGQGSSGIMIINGGTCNVTGYVTASPGCNITLLNGGLMND